MALCAVQFVDVLGVTVVVSTLPTMLSDLRADATAGSLVATAYAMFFGGLLLMGARFGDRYGHRQVLLAGLGVFAVGAVAGAAATSLTVLVIARCVQGAAAALSVPAALTLLVAVTPDGRPRDRAVALWSAAGAAAGASGFIVGGIVADVASWRAIFWAYVPTAVALMVVVVRSVPRKGGGTADDRFVVRVNVLGGMLFTAVVMAAVVGLTLLSEPDGHTRAVVLLGAGGVAAVAFVVVDRRNVAPLLPLSILALRHLREGAGGSLLNTAATSSSITLVTLYLQDTLHRSPAGAALVLLPFSLLVIVGSGWAARLLVNRSPRRVIAVGLAVIAVFNAALPATVRSAWALPMCVAMGGLGIGLSSVGATRLGTTVSEHARATASGILNTAAQAGTALGIAVLVLIASATGRTPQPGVSPPTAGWLVAAAVAAIAAVAFATPARHRRPESHRLSPQQRPSA